MTNEMHILDRSVVSQHAVKEGPTYSCYCNILIASASFFSVRKFGKGLDVGAGILTLFICTFVLFSIVNE